MNNGAFECRSGFAGHHYYVSKIVCENNGVWMAPIDFTCVGDFNGEHCEIIMVDYGSSIMERRGAGNNDMISNENYS